MGMNGEETVKPVIAIAYDFDDTLTVGNMQEHKLLPALGETKDSFWPAVKAETKSQDADEILTYMRLLLERAEAKGVEFSQKYLADHGRGMPLCEGVAEWFGRMNQRAADKGFELQHFVISSGLEEMIRGTSIEHEFAHIFASRYAYTEGVAIAPAVAVNYTTKTQYLFRINKGIFNCYDNAAVNRWMKPGLRPVPFERMIFIGDGDTDIPSMKMVRHQGGYSIAVFNPETERGLKNAHRLLAEDRVNYLADANYTQDSILDITVHGIIDRIAEKAGA